MTDHASVLRVVIADDTLIVREGVVAIASAIPGVEVVAQCGDFDELIAAVDAHTPDVVLTDVRMPPTMSDEGIVAAQQIRATRPSVGVVVLSQYAEPQFVLDLFAKGSERLGYLLKDHLGDPTELGRALVTVHRGGSVVDPRVVEVLVGSRTAAPSPVDRLTPREREVMALIAEGLNNAAIATELVLSEKAVAKHINSIFSKLDLGEDDDSHRRVKSVLTWLAAT